MITGRFPRIFRWFQVVLLCVVAGFDPSSAGAETWPESPAREPLDWSSIGNGVFLQNPSLGEAVRRARSTYPGLGTFLWYSSFGNPPASSSAFFASLSPGSEAGEARPIILQLGFEPALPITAADYEALPELERSLFSIQRNGAGWIIEFSLDQINVAFAGRGDLPDSPSNRILNRLYTNTVKWAEALREGGVPVILRPLSEMNYNPTSGSWGWGPIEVPGQVNTPEAFALAWCNLRRIFDEAGATRVHFVMSPLLTWRDPNMGILDVLRVLRLVPRGYIDGFGLNAYSRSFAGLPPAPFAWMARAWMDLYRGAGGHVHAGLPVIIPEMGVSALDTDGFAVPDALRRAWISDAFDEAARLGIRSVTYFDASAHWALPEGSLAREELRTRIPISPAASR